METGHRMDAHCGKDARDNLNEGNGNKAKSCGKAVGEDLNEGNHGNEDANKRGKKKPPPPPGRVVCDDSNEGNGNKAKRSDKDSTGKASSQLSEEQLDKAPKIKEAKQKKKTWKMKQWANTNTRLPNLLGRQPKLSTHFLIVCMEKGKVAPLRM